MPERGTVIRVLPGNRAVIMSSYCEFKEIRIAKGVKPGDEVVYSPEDVCKRRHYLRFAAIAASFLLFCLIAWSAFQQAAGARVYARVAFQINPALEISLDRSLRVKGVTAFDAKGESLVRGAGIVGKELDEAVTEIVRLSLQHGYLEKREANYIAVSFYFPGGADSRGLLQRVGARLETELEEQGIEAYIYYLRIARSEWQQARRKGVSPISYVLWRQAKSDGKSDEMISAVSLKDPGMKEVASRLAVRIGHSLKKQGNAGEASSAPERRRGEEAASPGAKGVNRQLRPSDLPETPGGKTAGPPAAESGSIRQKNAVPQENAGGGGSKAGTRGGGEAGAGAGVQGSTPAVGNSSGSKMSGSNRPAAQSDKGDRPEFFTRITPKTSLSFEDQ